MFANRPAAQASMSLAVRLKMKIGLLRQNTLTIWPDWIGARSTSSGAPAAMVEASGFHLPDQRRERGGSADRACDRRWQCKRKSRRVGSADEIAVTASILFRLAGHPIRAANRCRWLIPATSPQCGGGGRTGRLRPGEGQKATQSGGVLLAPLPTRVQVWPRRHRHNEPRALANGPPKRPAPRGYDHAHRPL